MLPHWGLFPLHHFKNSISFRQTEGLFDRPLWDLAGEMNLCKSQGMEVFSLKITQHVSACILHKTLILLLQLPYVHLSSSFHSSRWCWYSLWNCKFCVQLWSDSTELYHHLLEIKCRAFVLPRSYPLNSQYFASETDFKFETPCLWISVRR